MTETGLIIGQAVFLLLLFVFIGAVVRASVKALRTAEIEVLQGYAGTFQFIDKLQHTVERIKKRSGRSQL